MHFEDEDLGESDQNSVFLLETDFQQLQTVQIHQKRVVFEENFELVFLDLGPDDGLQLPPALLEVELQIQGGLGMVEEELAVDLGNGFLAGDFEGESLLVGEDFLEELIHY